MQLYTTYYPSPLGTLVLTSSAEHILSILFSDKMPGEENPSPLLQRLVDQLEAYFNGTLKQFDLPLLKEGTQFQKKVWDLLSQIPYGRTISYQALTKQYGEPKAIRAVAAANGKNNLAIVIPCHRVIGANQSLTGYAGGIWRKKWLLDHEAKHELGVQEFLF